MRVVLIVLLVALATAAVLFGPGLFRGSDDDVDGPAPRAKDGTSGTPDLQGAPGAAPGTANVPTEEPEPEILRIERPLKVLVLMGSSAQRWPRVMEVALRGDANMVVSGFGAVATAGTPPFGNGEPPPGGQPPTAAWFDAQGFDVLVVCDFDPSLVEPAFWESVAGRVRAGTLGVWLQPGVPRASVQGAPPPDEHPMLRAPGLASFLPVERAKAIRGNPLPGVFPGGATFLLATPGETHPASRIVFWPEWSRRTWQMGAAASPPWGTQFCYPVEALKSGSVVLVEAHPPTGAALPMYVQGPPAQGRVLWFGAQQIHDDTLRDGRQAAKWYALIHNAMVWLAGRT